MADVSAMVNDRLATGKPILVTRSAASGAEIDESDFFGEVDWIVPANASRLCNPG